MAGPMLEAPATLERIASKNTEERYWETRIAVPDTARARLVYPDSLRLLVADSAGSRDPRRRLVADALIEKWRRNIEEFGPRAAGYYQGYWGFINRMSRDLKAMHDAGIPILPGSDLAAPGLFPGFALHEELERMVEWIGMTPEAVLLAATRRSAELLGAADSLGTIEAGKLADIVLLEADPLLDIRHTRRIRSVVARGRLIDQSGIRGMLHGLDPTAGGDIRLSRRP